MKKKTKNFILLLRKQIRILKHNMILKIYLILKEINLKHVMNFYINILKNEVKKSRSWWKRKNKKSKLKSLNAPSNLKWVIIVSFPPFFLFKFLPPLYCKFPPNPFNFTLYCKFPPILLLVFSHLFILKTF